MSKLSSRYVGARPFETEQQLIFRGRQEDTEGLYRLIQLEQLTVLYGKSGTGKSSLLNAGIIPKVKSETDLLPVRVRFNAWREGPESRPPAETARLAVCEGVETHTTFLDQLIRKEASFWYTVKEHFIRYRGEQGLLLVMDQFEELFTYPPMQVQAFAEQLAEALFKTVPQRYWDVLKAAYQHGEKPLSAAELQLLQQQPALKVVLSIRSDRLHLLNRMDEHLPIILKNLYELDALSNEAAKQAIEEPAALPHFEDWFDTEPFLYAPSSIELILDFLTHKRENAPDEEEETILDASEQKIEATQLQIICSELEKRVKAQNLHQVLPEHLSDLPAIIEQYYENQILALPYGEQLSARRLIEEGLVFEEEERRLSLYEGQIFKTYRIRHDTLKQLVDAHLLRAEPSLSGGYTYELSHDTLVTPVLKAKNLRLEDERKEAKARADAQYEAELKAALDEAAKEKRRRQRATILAIVAVLALIGALIATGYAWQQTILAKGATRNAQNALRNALNEQIQRYELELSSSQRKIETYKKAQEKELVDLENTQLLKIQIRLDSAKMELQKLNESSQ